MQNSLCLILIVKRNSDSKSETGTIYLHNGQGKVEQKDSNDEVIITDHSNASTDYTHDSHTETQRSSAEKKDL